MNTKADANMWWIIIGAVIALVVLIVLMVIFTGKVNPLERGLSDCEGKGGVCVSSQTCPRSTLEASAFNCKETGERCCLGSPKRCGEGCAQEEVCGEDNYCYSR